MPGLKDKSIGVILYYRFPRSTKYLILKHKKGHWSFAKGHKEKEESAKQTASRELYEEACIDEVEFLSRKILLTERYTYINKNKVKVLKVVDYFIARSKTIKVKVDDKEIVGYKWSTLKGAEKILTYKQSKHILKKSSILINKKLTVKKRMKGINNEQV